MDQKLKQIEKIPNATNKQSAETTKGLVVPNQIKPSSENSPKPAPQPKQEK